MFDWFKKRSKPNQKPEGPRSLKEPGTPTPPLQSPPAKSGSDTAASPTDQARVPEKTVRGKLFLRGPRGDTMEEFDLIQSIAKMMRQQGHQVTCHEKWVVHDDAGLIIEPQLESLQLLDIGVQTVTTIDLRHLAIKAKRVFEYQHSAGEQLGETLDKGFDMWARGDLPALLDALSPSPKNCTMMVLDTPAKGDVPARKRRAILGPVSHLQTQKPAVVEEHPFCGCCFFAQTGKAFQHVMNNDGFYAIRYFGMRDENGVAGADCRVNGEEFEDGKAAIRAYVATWPGTGVELRRQYVIWQDMPGQEDGSGAISS